MRASQSSRRLVIAAAASVLTIGGLVALVLGSDGPETGPLQADESAPGGIATAAPTAPVPAIAPLPEAPPAPGPADETATAQDETPPPGADVETEGEAGAQPAAEPVGEPKPAPPAKPVAKRAPVRKRKVRRAARKTTPRVAKPKKSTYSGDFKSKFGSRK